MLLMAKAMPAASTRRPHTVSAAAAPTRKVEGYDPDGDQRYVLYAYFCHQPCIRGSLSVRFLRSIRPAPVRDLPSVLKWPVVGRRHPFRSLLAVSGVLPCRCD